MSATVFAEFKFWLLVLLSIVAPFGIYGALMAKRAISRWTVLAFGFGLVVLAGVDVWLLQNLEEAARHTPSLVDDQLFVSELRVALYLLPALFAGVGINMVSHVLVSHLAEAEARFESEKKD